MATSEETAYTRNTRADQLRRLRHLFDDYDEKKKTSEYPIFQRRFELAKRQSYRKRSTYNKKSMFVALWNYRKPDGFWDGERVYRDMYRELELEGVLKKIVKLEKSYNREMKKLRERALNESHSSQANQDESVSCADTSNDADFIVNPIVGDEIIQPKSLGAESSIRNTADDWESPPHVYFTPNDNEGETSYPPVPSSSSLPYALPGDGASIIIQPQSRGAESSNTIADYSTWNDRVEGWHLSSLSSNLPSVFHSMLNLDNRNSDGGSVRPRLLGPEISDTTVADWGIPAQDYAGNLYSSGPSSSLPSVFPSMASSHHHDGDGGSMQQQPDCYSMENLRNEGGIMQVQSPEVSSSEDQLSRFANLNEQQRLLDVEHNLRKLA
ncbi:hypothetical protein EV361DRAFT_948751 [Lentinula raphanica]|nr:hypothetical protein EV361DRAFT_948751 [Lentinula raphanica]